MKTDNAIFDMIFEDAFRDMCMYEDQETLIKILENYISCIDSETYDSQAILDLFETLDPYIQHSINIYEPSEVLEEGRVLDAAKSAFNSRVKEGSNKYNVRNAYGDFKTSINNAKEMKIADAGKAAKLVGNSALNVGKHAVGSAGKYLAGGYHAADAALKEHLLKSEYLKNLKTAGASTFEKSNPYRVKRDKPEEGEQEVPQALKTNITGFRGPALVLNKA